MADDKPINSKPFSNAFSFNTSTSNLVPNSTSRQITSDYSLDITTPLTSAAPVSGTTSISNLLTGSTPIASTSSSLLKTLPVSSDISNVASIMTPQATSLSSYLSGNTQFISKPLTAVSSTFLSSTTPSLTATVDNSTTTPVEAQTSSDVSDSQNLTQYLNNLAPNMLNSYAQATYHLKLFLVKSDQVLNQTGTLDEWIAEGVFANENIIVIAESGVTAGLYIETFTVSDVVSYSNQFNSSGVNGSMTIREPLGSNFIDYFNGAIDDLGYETRVQAPVFLEISFRGYDENGNYMNIDDIGTKMYRFITKKIDAKFVSSGTTYTIDFAVASDIARQMSIANTSNNVTVQGAKVQDFFDKLTAEWNKAGKDVEQDDTQPPAPTTGTSGAVPSGNSDQSALQPTEDDDKPTPSEKNEFEIIVDDLCVEYKDCLTWEVGKASSPDRYRTANTSFADGAGPGTIQATWGPGSSRVGILLDVLYSTKKTQTLIVNGKQDDEVKPGSKELGGTSFVPEIDIRVESTDYNSETHTYNKKITYIIQERKTTQVNTTPKDINEASTSEKALINKLPYVRRRYDYFGTGKNTEILDLSIEVSKDFMVNLPAYNAQKRTAVADNPSTSQQDIQAKQVADGNKVSAQQGVKKPTPVNPDAQTTTSTSATSGTTTSDTTLNSSTNTTVASPILTTAASTIPPTTTPATNAEVEAAMSVLNNYKAQIHIDAPTLTDAEKQQRAAQLQIYIDDASQKVLSNMKQTQLNSQIQLTNSLNNIDSQLASIAGTSRPLDTVTQQTSSALSITGGLTPTTGTLAYGANLTKVNSIISNPVSRANDTSTLGKRYLEDFSRTKADSPRGDVGNYRPVISTDINNRGGYNLDDSSGIGKSYITALLGGMYGQQADMSRLTMEVRGDPLWLGVRNKATRDQAGTRIIKDKDGKELPPSDHKVLLSVVFPAQYDENTGLAVPNKVSEGYTAFYNLRTVTSTFDGGKFTQKLDLYQDLSTEQVRKYIDPSGSASI